MSIGSVKLAARLALHRAMSRAAVYVSHDGAVTPCTVRVHREVAPFGAGGGAAGYGAAERVELIPEVVALAAEIDPERGGVFVVAADTGGFEGYEVENPLLPDGITVSSQVSRLSAEQIAGLPTPG